MEYTIKVIGYLKCTMNCSKYNDNRCCINCGTYINECETPCGFIMELIYKGIGVGQDYIKEKCSGCVN